MAFKLLTLTLPCTLNHEELEAKGQELAKLTQDIATTEEEKSASASTYGSTLKTMYGDQFKLSKIVSEKLEERSVECEKHFNLRAGTFRIVRKDTGEVVEKGEMTQAEIDAGQDLFNQGES